ncbi:VOC family protein [Pseudonocardia nigra]|uniref:VOC family protein n=1 Tax=Pseudonocardia nigra TaxID=1921578 RepID=UPI001C5D5F32|nr:VOC family protein [Pseudonocardia nigra]
MAPAIAMVTVDCADTRVQSQFWAAALGTEVRVDFGDWVMLEPPPAGGPSVGLQRVPEPRSGKNRLHFDLAVAPGDRQREVERLVGLGAAVVGERGGAEAGFVWTTLTDPEGNEFCVAEPAQ